VHVLANSRPVDGITRDQLLEYFATHDIDSSTWEFVRHGTVRQYAFKVGETPGVVLFLDVESVDSARELVDALPVVANGLLTFDIDPLRATARF